MSPVETLYVELWYAAYDVQLPIPCAAAVSAAVARMKLSTVNFKYNLLIAQCLMFYSVSQTNHFVRKAHSARIALPLWLMAFFSSALISANVRLQPSG